MLKKILVLLAFAPMAFANDHGSEFYFQADADQRFLTPSFTYILSSDIEASGSEVDYSGMFLGLEYEMGINEMLSWTAGIGYQSTETELSGSTSETSGLEDLDFGLKGHKAMGPGSLRFGANLDVSLSDNEVDANGDENAMSGGMELTPYIGYMMTSGSCTYGARLSQGIEITERTQDDNGTEKEISGSQSTEIALFYEHTFGNDRMLGVSISQATQTDEDTTTNGTTTTDEADGAATTIDVYAPMAAGNGILIPHLSYLTDSDEAFDSFGVISVIAEYRMSF